ncbi:MAG: hypothetical protein AAB489_03630 [Patescibacteria group bacterium]
MNKPDAITIPPFDEALRQLRNPKPDPKRDAEVQEQQAISLKRAQSEAAGRVIGSLNRSGH